MSKSKSAIVWCGAGGSTPYHVSLLYSVLSKGDFYISNGKIFNKKGEEVIDQVCISGGIIPWLIISTSKNNDEAIERMYYLSEQKIWNWSKMTLLIHKPWALGIFGNITPVADLIDIYLKKYPLLISQQKFAYFLFRDIKTKQVIIKRPTKTNLSWFAAACMSSPHLGLRNSQRPVIDSYYPTDAATIFRSGGYHFTNECRKFLQKRHPNTNLHLTSFDPIGGAYLFLRTQFESIEHLAYYQNNDIANLLTVKLFGVISSGLNLIMRKIIIGSLYKGIHESDTVYTRYFETNNTFMRTLNRIFNLNRNGREHESFLYGKKSLLFAKITPSEQTTPRVEGKFFLATFL